MKKMKKILFVSFLSIVFVTCVHSQITLPADANKKASVSENIGITTIKIDYSRPQVKGREGKIWGELVH